MINICLELFGVTRPILVVAFKLFLYKCNYFTVFIYQIENLNNSLIETLSNFKTIKY